MLYEGRAGRRRRRGGDNDDRARTRRMNRGDTEGQRDRQKEAHCLFSQGSTVEKRDGCAEARLAAGEYEKDFQVISGLLLFTF